MAGLSKPYNSVVDAVMGGFKRSWERRPVAHQRVRLLGRQSAQQGQEDGDLPLRQAGEQRLRHVETTLPSGVPVFANCHTHPKSTKTGDFSTGDKRQFQKVRKARPGIDWYLLNPSGQIRRAITAGEFPAGVPVKWNDKITP